MARFAGIKNERIHIISSINFEHPDYYVFEIPKEFDGISSPDLIANFRVRNNNLKTKFSKKAAKDLKVAFVGNWKMQCGIATYAEKLWGEVIKLVGDYKFFVEKIDSVESSEKVLPCWKRGESLRELATAIKDYDPDIVWIQHEFGLWPNACYWLSLINQLSDYRIIITMHSVFYHRDKTICEAAMPEVVVHLDGAQDVLKNVKKIPGKVYVIPHGCEPCVSRERLWNFYKSEHTFMQFGFGFRYKGWENAIKATAILKQKYPDVFFTGLFSESDFNKVEHQMYYNELMGLVGSLNLEDNVAIIKGFQSDETLDSYLRTNKVVIFPYVSHPAHEVFGASGAARLAMAKAVPVITTSVNHFSDLPTIKADTPEAIAAELEQLFSHPQAAKEQVERQIKYLEDNTWDKIAARYVQIFENP
jgi:glycosyltransferase involved in cell wall biosynthesis